MIKPPRLKSGDVVGVVSPSTPVFSKRELSRGMKTLESLGFKPKLGPRALDVHANYQAGTREDRLHDLHTMFVDDEVKAIFCTGGGYAAIQLLPDIDWGIIEKNPKIFVGYSDIVTLLNPITEKTGLVTFHGPTVEGGLASDLVVSQRSSGGKYMLKSFKNTLMKGEIGKLPAYTEWKVLRPGRAEGTLVGGNLNVMLGLIGTPYEPKWDGKILFWEEVDETIEGIDNYLWRLRIAKVFKKIEGMVVGKITNLQPIDEDDREKWASLERPPVVEDIILKATEGFNFPILYGVDFGHDVTSLTLPIGANALLDCPGPGRTGKLSIVDKYLSD
ncbi:LD-carboxypeptidase [Candidatus Jorgensenbacteria bacterium]|nr:LD-carboxypeptidase [Candidatus Jorgensenbacteria bacterium]